MKDQHCNNCRKKEGCRITPDVTCIMYIIRTEWMPDDVQVEYDNAREERE